MQVTSDVEKYVLKRFPLTDSPYEEIEDYPSRQARVPLPPPLPPTPPSADAAHSTRGSVAVATSPRASVVRPSVRSSVALRVEPRDSGYERTSASPRPSAMVSGGEAAAPRGSRVLSVATSGKRQSVRPSAVLPGDASPDAASPLIGAHAAQEDVSDTEELGAWEQADTRASGASAADAANSAIMAQLSGVPDGFAMMAPSRSSVRVAPQMPARASASRSMFMPQLPVRMSAVDSAASVRRSHAASSIAPQSVVDMFGTQLERKEASANGCVGSVDEQGVDLEAENTGSWNGDGSFVQREGSVTLRALG